MSEPKTYRIESDPEIFHAKRGEGVINQFNAAFAKLAKEHPEKYNWELESFKRKAGRKSKKQMEDRE